MGMYTALNLACEIKQDCPEYVIKVLQCMTSGNNSTWAQNLETEFDLYNVHDFFKTDHWYWILKGDSYYFPAQTYFTLVNDALYPDKPMYFLTGVCNIKNYHDDIELFCDWLAPFILVTCDSEQFVGFKRYEEDVYPTLLFIVDGKAEWRKVDGTA